VLGDAFVYVGFARTDEPRHQNRWIFRPNVGMSDYAVFGKIREANVALIVLTQSYLSLLPPHGNKDLANVLVLNLRNRMIFRAADAECVKQSAEFIGKKIANKRSRSVGSRGVTYSYQETEEYKVKPHQLRAWPCSRSSCPRGRLFSGCQGDDQRSEIFGSDIERMCLTFPKKDRFAGTDRLDLVLAVEFDLAFKNGEHLMFP
jgi:TraM recognition site of TraD and TraG